MCVFRSELFPDLSESWRQSIWAGVRFSESFWHYTPLYRSNRCFMIQPIAISYTAKQTLLMCTDHEKDETIAKVHSNQILIENSSYCCVYALESIGISIERIVLQNFQVQSLSGFCKLIHKMKIEEVALSCQRYSFNSTLLAIQAK